ncbi:MAG TPA: hypothetical protein VK914_07140 [bacterium]|jgi:hypothetical protein|nr:hypothetical protein [bacterium]
MSKIPFVTLALALLAGLAHADALEISGFGGYTSLGMKQVNAMLADPKGQAGYDQTTTTDISNGYVVGLDVRSGLIIPIPFVELGLRGEYVGASGDGEAAGTSLGVPYKVTLDPSMLDLMLGLTLGTSIPDSGLSISLSAYGGYGEGAIQQSASSGSFTAPDIYSGGGFVGELEARLGIKLISALSLYGFGGMRFANLGVFSDPNKDKFGAGFPGESGPPQVDFSGVTGGLGLNLAF